MSMVGQQLTSPEPGWKRYDDTDPSLKYEGIWNSVSYASYYSGSMRISRQGEANNLRFRFKGRKIRIIAAVNSNFQTSEEVKVDIGGSVEEYTNKYASTVYQVVVYEKTGLENTIHDVEIGNTYGEFYIDAIDIDKDGEILPTLAKVGDQLLQPEEGWRRYDDNHHYIKYEGNFTRISSGVYYGGSMNRLMRSEGEGKIAFSFSGTRIRIISHTSSSVDYGDILITVDEVDHVVPITNQTSTSQVLIFELTGLEDRIHAVQMSNKIDGEVTSHLFLDAVDVDENGSLTAQVRDHLAYPDEGWRRYDDTHSHIRYEGIVTTLTSSELYGGSATSIRAEDGEGKARFKMRGTKLRIISRIADSDAYGDLVVKIDGTEYTFNTRNEISTLAQILVFSVDGLEDGEHQVEIINHVGDHVYRHLYLDAIDIDEDGELIPPPVQVGYLYPEPEMGWERYDDRYYALKYSGGGWRALSVTNDYDTTLHEAVQALSNNSTLSFKFVGTKIRIVGGINQAYANYVVNVDGTEYILPVNGGSTTIRPALIGEVTGLSRGEHFVQITGDSDKALSISSIEIDDDGEIIHPDEVYDIDDLEIGKRIRCHYRTTAQNRVGIFSNLGKTTADLLPTTPEPVADGDFYFIAVDKKNDDIILMADRVIQDTISWNTLNNEGIASGKGIELPQRGAMFKRLPEPATSEIAGTGLRATVSADGTYIAVGHNTSPYLVVYKKEGNRLTRLAIYGGALPNMVYGVAFSPDNTYLAVSHSNAPVLSIYKRDGDTFRKLTNPLRGTAIQGASGRDVAFSPDGSHLAMGFINTSPYMAIYKVGDGDIFTRLANPGGGLPTATVYGVAYSPDGEHLAVGHTTSRFLTLYKRTGDSYSRLPDPVGGLPTHYLSGLSYSPDGKYLSVSSTLGDKLAVYKRDGDTYTKLPVPPTFSGNGTDVAFSPDGEHVAVSHKNAPYVTIYKRVGDEFRKLNDSTLETVSGAIEGLSFSGDGSFLVATGVGEPNTSIYEIGEYELLDRKSEVETTVRLPTGGVDNNDKDNDWDNYVVGSDLNGNVVPGHNHVWNCEAYTWTSTSHSSNTSNRVTRGSNGIPSGHGSIGTLGAVRSNYGFRPVLVIRMPEVLTLGGNLSQSDTELEDIAFVGEINHLHEGRVRYTVYVNEQEYVTSSFQNSPLIINVPILNDDLNVGGNTVEILVEDEEGRTVRKTYTVTKLTTYRYLIREGQVYKTFKEEDSMWVNVGMFPSETLFIEQGMRDLTNLVEPISQMTFTSDDGVELGSGYLYTTEINTAGRKVIGVREE